MRKIGLILIIGVVILSSCATWKKTSNAKKVDITQTRVIHKPIIADLSVGLTKVRGNATGLTKNLQAVKIEAVKAALYSANDGDVLIEPNFTISTRKKRVQVEVTGYPAMYNNFRSIEESDATLMDIIHVYGTMEMQKSVFQRHFFKRVKP